MKCEVTPGQVQEGLMERLEVEMLLELSMSLGFEQGSPPSHATAPLYVPGIGRGQRRQLNPLDIPLPMQYYRQLEEKALAARQKQEPSHPKLPNARPAKDRPPSTRPALDRPMRASPTRPVRDRPDVTSAPGRGRAKGRGRGRAIEDGLKSVMKQKPNVMQIRDCVTGLPNGNADAAEGKARLMEMFLSRGSQFEREAELAQHDFSSDSSVRSAPPAPTFDLRNNRDFPEIISKGLPFRSSGGGSLDEPRGRREKGRGSRRREGLAGERGGASSTGGETAERGGVQSTDNEWSEERGGAAVSSDADMEMSSGLSASHQRVTSSDEDGLQALEGAHVLELLGLPSNLSEQDLGDLLMSCGQIIQIRLLRDPDCGGCIGLGYVRMEDMEACEMAVASLNDVESPFADRYHDDVPKLSVRILPS